MTGEVQGMRSGVSASADVTIYIFASGLCHGMFLPFPCDSALATPFLSARPNEFIQLSDMGGYNHSGRVCSGSCDCPGQCQDPTRRHCRTCMFRTTVIEVWI